MSLIFGLAFAATAPAAPTAILDELGRNGTLTVASGDRPSDRQKVLEIEVRTCNIAFKTKLLPNGFAAHMIDIGEGGKIKRVGRNTVRLDGSTRFPKMSVLVSGGETKALYEALEAVRKSCERSEQIF